MSDISTVWFRDLAHGDWSIEDGILAQGNDLVTSVLISLFTDRIAQPDDIIPDGTTDARGWIGDLNEDAPIGSRIWLLDRSKQTAETLNKAQIYIAEALTWLVDDGVVAGFEITVQWVRASFLGAQIVAHKPNGDAELMNFNWAWSGI